MKPERPNGLNSDNAAIWDAIAHLTDRVDKVMFILVGAFATAATAAVGAFATLAAVLVK